MESFQEKFLTLDEKAKLKERLALLKKEYRKTVNRLQRSQRAERVKSHVKKTIEEQNRLLSQECALVSPGLANCTSRSSGDVRESQASAGAHIVDKDRKLCVTFNLEPEVLHAGGCSPSYSCGESSGREADTASRGEGDGTINPKQRRRSRLRLSRSLKRDCLSDSPSTNVPQLNGIINGPDGQQINTGAESLSPVLKKCLKEDLTIKNDTTMRFSSENTKAVDVSPEIGGSIDAGASITITTDYSPCDRMHNDTTKIQTSNTTSTEPSHSGIIYDRLVTEEELGRSCNVTSCTPHSSLLCSGNQSLRNVEVHEQSPVREEERNPLTSCTLVEGLLFPVEYYVRTTRRMTSCQRKVDLDAVINSHLGLAKKGTRGRQWKSRTSLSPSLTGEGSQSALNHLTVSNSAGEVTQSRRGKGRKSCPAVMSSSGMKDVSVQLKFGSDVNLALSGFQSEKENCEANAPSKGEVLKPSNHFESVPSERKGYSLRTQSAANLSLLTLPNDTEDFEANPFIHRTSKESSEPTGSSPFPSFSGRVSLEHLSQFADVTDFHLPDKEFGTLKLEKLKSTCHLETFVPKAAKVRKKSVQGQRIHRSTLQERSAVLRGTLAVYPSASEPDLKLLTLHENRLHDEQSSDSQGNAAGNNVPLSIEVSKNGPVIAQVCLNSDPMDALNLSTNICRLAESKFEAYNCRSSPKKCPYPPHQPFEGVNLDSAMCAEEEKLCNSDTVSKTDAQTPLGALNHHEPNLPVRSMDVLGKLAQPESVGDNLLVLSADMESGEGAQSPTDTPANLSSPKTLTCSVLFSTSMCSVPLDSRNECVAADCTSQFPFLGQTPAVFSSPQSGNTPVNTCREHTVLKTAGILPEFSGKDAHEYTSVFSEESVVPGETDVSQFSGVFPQSGDVSQECDITIVHKPCDNTEDCGTKCLPAVTLKVNKDEEVDETAHRLDYDNAEGGTLENGSLRLISEIQDSCGGGCTVDLCSVWWEFSGCTDLCVVSASESSVCLWRPLAEGKWDCAHTWNFIEMPVIQILPLSQEKNIACVALGNLDILEIWVLFSHPESQRWEKQLVKCGNIKTAQGLSRYRVVCSSGVADGQVVELWQLSEGGSTVGSLTLMAPTGSFLAFSEVEGERNALVGSTVDNNLVVWNSVTGHLLSVIYIGDLCSDVISLHATSDSGLLFLVVGSLFSKDCEATGSCIFSLITANAREGASALIMSYIIPGRLNSRYLEGDVKEQSAAAVLTCGSIALWDLPRSHCSTMLAPSSDTPWSLVRWCHRPSCLLTGRKDGTIFVYEYTAHQSNKTRDDLGEVV
ncbi:partner and localizer of BRCA2 [Pseudophryne corroboree]|uniref:partner and localizer of BRCA2 n=1 Tax=Pseudophryne corroboree TaxID=495146 RepID=UPI003081C613